MQRRFELKKLWGAILEAPDLQTNYWPDNFTIPLGSLLPPETYKGKIPMCDIVTIKFDPTDTPFTKRNAFNVLLLGGSGDGKSMLMKIIWWVLHYSGYFCVYVDPKSTDAGRAKKAWKSRRIPPLMSPMGIPLVHFVPVWATQKSQALMHNFEVYTTRLSRIDEREMWQGLGMQEVGASVVKQILDLYGGDISLEELEREIHRTPDEELPQQSRNNVLRTIKTIQHFGVVSPSYPELDLMRAWRGKEGNRSAVLSYNNASKQLMTFDLGQKIREASMYYQEYKEKVPIIFLLDDASFYARDLKPLVKYNFASEQIIEIGNNYRSIGLNNILAVQTLGIVDEDVADTYKIKIISPKFRGADQLGKIGVPDRAIRYLKSGALSKDKKKRLMQYLLITEDDEVVPFYPFTPPCNHFDEIYFPKQEVVTGA